MSSDPGFYTRLVAASHSGRRIRTAKESLAYLVCSLRRLETLAEAACFVRASTRATTCHSNGGSLTAGIKCADYFPALTRFVWPLEKLATCAAVPCML